MKHLKFLEETSTRKLFDSRSGEVKIGEKIAVLGTWSEINESEAQFVIIGIQEEIGVKANLGRPACANTFQKVLPALLGVQNNRFIDVNKIALGPYLDFSDYQAEADHLEVNKNADLERLRALCSEIDQEVSALIQAIVKAHKIPIVIGGGHNNSYGLIRGSAEALASPLNVLNIDPHADFRALEGRHSGNGFSYAKSEGHLNRYAVFGLHESYNNQMILEQFRASADLYYLSYDELLSFSTDERDRLFKDALRWLGPGPVGLELDLDSVQGYPASALNASGFTMRQARLMIQTAASLAAPSYLHLAEAAPNLAPNAAEREMSIKALVYLITDFIKSYAD